MARSTLPPRLLLALRQLARRPQLLIGCGCAPFLLLFLLALALLGRRCIPREHAPRDAGAQHDTAATTAGDVGPDASPRVLLNRVWFDRLPEKATDTFDLWIFLAGGIGLREQGSRYRATIDLFEFERRGSTLEGRHLHDGARIRTTFDVRTCDDHPPFSLCLTIADIAGGKKELYGFGEDDEMDRHAPAARAVLAAARARADVTRGSRPEPSR